MTNNHVKLHTVIVAGWLCFICLVSAAYAQRHDAVHVVLDRLVDGNQAVFLMGRAEREWIVPLANIADGQDQLIEGMHGYLHRTPCSQQERGVCIQFTTNLHSVERARARVAAKLETLRKRGSPTVTTDRAGATDPSFSRCAP